MNTKVQIKDQVGNDVGMTEERQNDEGMREERQNDGGITEKSTLFIFDINYHCDQHNNLMVNFTNNINKTTPAHMLMVSLGVWLDMVGLGVRLEMVSLGVR